MFLFYGARPSWRALADGITPGADVLELKQNLTALGYANATNLTVDTGFTWATNLAIRRWQLATGQPVTGQLALGRVVYEPGPIQILSTPSALGDLASPGQPVLQASSTTPTITVPVPAAQTYLVHAGDAVTVTLPSGTVTPGKIDSISAIASQNQTSNNGGGSSNAPSGPSQASVPAVVSLTDPTAAANLDQAPVTVNITDRTVTGVLAVPITALVALAGGGYGVWVDTAPTPPAVERPGLGRGDPRFVRDHPRPGNRARAAGRRQGRGPARNDRRPRTARRRQDLSTADRRHRPGAASTCESSWGRPSRSPAPRAPANRPCSTCSAPWNDPAEAACTSPASTPRP